MSESKGQERLIQNMKDAGCSDDTIRRFLSCNQAGDTKGGLTVLSHHRQHLLDELHGRQREIDCLDYLIYQIEKNA